MKSFGSNYRGFTHLSSLYEKCVKLTRFSVLCLHCISFLCILSSCLSLPFLGVIGLSSLIPTSIYLNHFCVLLFHFLHT